MFYIVDSFKMKQIIVKKYWFSFNSYFLKRKIHEISVPDSFNNLYINTLETLLTKFNVIEIHQRKYLLNDIQIKKLLKKFNLVIKKMWIKFDFIY